MWRKLPACRSYESMFLASRMLTPLFKFDNPLGREDIKRHNGRIIQVYVFAHSHATAFCRVLKLVS